MADDEYLIWSNEHGGWWRPNEHGYCNGLLGAGRYSRERAIEICKQALMTAPHIKLISEIPVRLADIKEVLRGEVVPQVVMADPQAD